MLVEDHPEKFSRVATDNNNSFYEPFIPSEAYKFITYQMGLCLEFFL